jgi:signal transduction histidine kinase
MARDVLAGHLFRDGYEFVFAANGEEALALVDGQLPDAVLLDVMMPEIDGYTVCRQLKADERWCHIPVILVTALGGTANMVRGFEVGADDFVTKPVDELELRARVRSVLRIKEQYDKLQEAFQLREDLARMIVYDMRTPLTALLGFSERLQMGDSLSMEALSEVSNIHANARRLDSFLNDLLMIAKMEEAGQLILNRTMVSINRLVEHVGENQALFADLKQIKVVLDLLPGSRLILVDANLFQRVLENLLSNAIKFSPTQSTVTIRLETFGKKIETEPLQPNIRIKVLDEGPGIAQEHRVQIFNRFETTDVERSDAPQIGLGLVFCKMVVEAHGGRISVDDNKPAGSIFTVSL